MIVFTSFVYADWWDCKAQVEKRGFMGYSTHYGGEVSREVSADRKSTARSNAVYQGGRYFVPGFVGSTEYVCAVGNTEENGNSCKWRFTGYVECRRQ